MPGRERTVVVKFLGDEKGAVRAGTAVDKSLAGVSTRSQIADASLKKVSSTLSSQLGPASGLVASQLGGIASAGGKMGLAVSAGAALAGTGIGAFVNNAVQANSNLNEQISATRVLFGAASDEVLAFGKTAASSLGLSNRAALQSANGFATLFTNAGFGERQSAKLSEGLVQLAADLASFLNLSPEEALEKLRSGLVGEAEPLRRLGITINETAVKSKALQLGLGGAHRELTEGEKISARYALIIDQTSKAQGDLARTADSLANKQRNANAELEDAKARFGAAAVPAYIGFLQTATATLEGFTGEQKKANQDGGFEKLGRSLGKFFSGGPQAAISDYFKKGKETGDELLSTTDRLNQVMPILGQTMTSLNAGITTTAQQASAAIKILSDEATVARSTLTGYLGAQRGLTTSSQGVRNASESLSDARKNLNDLLRKGAVDTKAVASAEREVRDTARGVTDAERQLADAIKRRDEVAQGASDRDKQRANINYRQSIIAVAQAHEAEADAVKRVNEARRSGKPGDLRKANLDLASAQLATEEAGLSSADAQDSLNEANGVGEQAAQKLRDANREVEEAEYGVTRSKEAHTTAQQDLTEAVRGDVEFTDKVVAARRAVRSAEEGLTGALDAQNTARLQFSDSQAQFNALVAAGGAVTETLVAQLRDLVQYYPALNDVLGKVLVAQAQTQLHNIFNPGAPKGDGTGAGPTKGFQSLIAAADSSGIPHSVTSTNRPGAITSTGNLSYHAQGKAVDFGGSPANLRSLFGYFERFAGPGGTVSEQFYSPMGYGWDVGRRLLNSQIAPSVVRDHYDHLHVATYDRGGILPPGLTLALNKTGKNEYIADPRAPMGVSKIEINVHGVRDPEEVTRRVVSALQRYQKGNGRSALAPSR